MLKSLVESLVSVYEALFKDLYYAFPQLKRDFEMDLNTLRLAATNRGISTFVLDLPALGKHLDRCLAMSKWTLSGLPFSQGDSVCRRLPKFLRGLYKLVFSEEGTLRDDYSVEAIISLRQVLCLAKKVPLPFSEEALDASVSDLFTEDACLPKPEKFWTADHLSTCMIRNAFSGFSRSRYYNQKVAMNSQKESVSVVLTCLDAVSRRVCAALGSYDPFMWRFRHGPGAISQRPGTVHNKYQWYGWSDRLESVYPIAEHGFHSYVAWAGATYLMRLPGYTPVSRLVAVPKTYQKPRLIAAEPSEHQWCQQNLWHYFRTNSALTWIDNFVRFRDQSLNQELCISGSKDGSLATVDLKSASDRVSCHAVGCFFRHNLDLLNALRATRTQFLEQRLTESQPERLELRKFSTMGSACTFPVETLMFLGIALSCVLTRRQLKPTVKNIVSLQGEVAVFGDDIIVPSDCRELLQSTLEVLDFKVNESKTFSEGFFRESCGVDCYRGVDVTPVYVRSLCMDTPESLSSVVDCTNNFYHKFYLHVSAYLESTLQQHKTLATVRAGSGHFGLHSRVGTSFYRRRWNKNLQREEVRILSSVTKTSTADQEDDTMLHQFFTELPGPYTKWEAGVRSCPSLELQAKWVDLHECQ